MNVYNNKIKTYCRIIIKYFSYVFVVFFYFIDLFYLRILNRTHIDSDMSTMMVLANHLNKERKLLSQTWFYATELRVINTHLLFKIALKIFPDNWSVARLLVQAVMLALYAFVLLLLSKQLELGKMGGYIVAMLLCPIGYWYLWYVIFANVYLTHILFCLISTVLAMAFIKSKNIKCTMFYSILGIIFAFICSLNGVRYLMIYYAPFCLAAFVILIFELRTYSNISFTNYIRESIKNELSAVRLFVYSIATITSAFCGYAYTVVVLSKTYPFQTMNKTMWTTFSIDRFLNSWSLFLGLFGYGVDSYIDNETLLFSFRGISCGLGLLFAFALIFSIFRLVKRWEKLTLLYRMFIILTISIFFVDSIVYALTIGDTVIDNGSYWLHLVPYAFLIIGIEIKTETFSLSNGKELITATMMLSVIIISLGTFQWFYNEPYRGNVHLTDVKNFLINEGHLKGYATFWYGNVLTELSDGQIEVWTTWDDIEQLCIIPWAQIQEHAVTYPDSGGFVLIGPNDNLSDTAFSMSDNISEVYADEYGYKVFIFE